MTRLAKSLWSVAAQEAEETQLAVAWLARNLIMRQGLSVDESCSRVGRLWVGADFRARDCPEFADRRFCRAFSVLCQVWAGDRSDPTRGATIAHRHDETPSWVTEPASATALIGPWIFYRPD